MNLIADIAEGNLQAVRLSQDVRDWLTDNSTGESDAFLESVWSVMPIELLFRFENLAAEVRQAATDHSAFMQKLSEIFAELAEDFASLAEGNEESESDQVDKGQTKG